MARTFRPNFCHRLLPAAVGIAVLVGSHGAQAGLDLDPKQEHTVRIELVGQMRMLNVLEVEVKRGDENLARQGEAVMAPGPAESGASRLIDGDADGAGDASAHTYWQVAPWLEIRLPKTDRLDEVVVWNRAPIGEDIAARLLPFEVSVRDARGKVVATQLVREGLMQSRREFKNEDTRHRSFVVRFDGAEEEPATAAKPEAAPQVLLDFEKDDDRQAFTGGPTSGTSLETTRDWAAGGRQSLRVSFNAAHGWAQFALERTGGAAEFFAALEGSTREALAFTVHNPQDREVWLNLTRAEAVSALALGPRETRRVEIPLDRLRELHAGGLAELSGFKFLAVPGQEDFAVHFDDFALVDSGKTAENARREALARAAAQARTTGGDLFALGVQSAMRHVFPEPERTAPDFVRGKTVRLARQESESFQLVVVPLRGALRNVTWSATAPAGPGGLRLPVSVRVVGYVRARPVQSLPDSPGGWYPDLLVDASSVATLPAETQLALWVKVRAPANAPAGAYRGGSVTVRAAGAKPQTVTLDAEVWPFTLPMRPTLATACGLQDNYNGHGLAKIYPEANIPEVRRRYEDLLLGEYRLDVSNIYRTGAPWHWDADRLRELKAMGARGFCLGYFPEKPSHSTEPDLEKRIEDLRNYMAVVEEAGVRDMCYFYGYDESPPDKVPDLIAVAGRLKQEFPGIPFLTTATSFQGGTGALEPGAEVVDWWCPFSSAFAFKPDVISAVAARAKALWYYVCNVSTPPQPNLDLEYPPAVARLMLGAIPRKYGLMGFLYYALNSWGNNALPAGTERLPFVDWHANGISWPEHYNGQGVLLAAGADGPIPTIRLEMMRDGLDDHDYYALLAATDPAAAEVPAAVVWTMALYTTDPTTIEAERERLARAISGATTRAKSP